MGYLEYGVITFFLLVIEALNNSRISKQLGYMSNTIKRAEIMIDLHEESLEYISDLGEYWNTEAKIVKGFGIVFVLMIYGSWEFAYVYIGGRTLLFSPIHSYFWKGRLQPISWYFKNSIAVRIYEYLKGFF